MPRKVKALLGNRVNTIGIRACLYSTNNNREICKFKVLNDKFHYLETGVGKASCFLNGSEPIKINHPTTGIEADMEFKFLIMFRFRGLHSPDAHYKDGKLFLWEMKSNPKSYFFI